MTLTQGRPAESGQPWAELWNPFRGKEGIGLYKDAAPTELKICVGQVSTKMPCLWHWEESVESAFEKISRKQDDFLNSQLKGNAHGAFSLLPLSFVRDGILGQIGRLL